MRFRFEQSPTEIDSGAGGLSLGGLSLVGSLINRYSELSSQLKSLPLRHRISHEDIVRTYLGLLCQGKNDFEAVEGVREDTFFRQALGTNGCLLLLVCINALMSMPPP